MHYSSCLRKIAFDLRSFLALINVHLQIYLSFSRLLDCLTKPLISTSALHIMIYLHFALLHHIFYFCTTFFFFFCSRRLRQILCLHTILAINTILILIKSLVVMGSLCSAVFSGLSFTTCIYHLLWLH